MGQAGEISTVLRFSEKVELFAFSNQSIENILSMLIGFTQFFQAASSSRTESGNMEMQYIKCQA